MKIAICEDQIEQANLLTSQIQNWAKENKINISIDNFSSAEAFLFEWIDYNKYDIIFLDIEMSKVSGIELSNIIREKNKEIDIVFVSGFFKYALHGYRVGALQYLLKPIKESDLYICLDRTLNRIFDTQEDSKSTIIIKTAKENIKLDYKDICYCIMFSPYIDIHTKEQKITLRKKISDIEELLPSKYFIRCHRSYIVNVMHIRSVIKTNVILENGVKIPISRGKYNEVNDAFINYICE